jgi:hypothetical protein
MKRITPVTLLALACLALPALAGEPLQRTPQSIPVYSLSPGASGSIGGSARSQRQDVPPVPGLLNAPATRTSTVYGSSGVQQSGGLRQSVEYPNGMRVPQPSVQRSYQLRRDE